MNVRKLRKLQKWILDEPRRLDMTDWVGFRDTVAKQNPPCGTVGCLAGMACHMEGGRLDIGSGWRVFFGSEEHAVAHKADEILDLDDHQHDLLFYLHDVTSGHWPTKFVSAYKKAKTLKTRAKVAAARIEHFIKTKGAE